MASRLYPPILEASIPAFYGNRVGIPFKPNPLVGITDFQNFALQIKKINGELVGVFYSISYDKIKNIIYFNLNNALGENPNWFKFQIAYNTETLIGYYSSAAVGRYLGKTAPIFKIQNSRPGIYSAIYKHPNDLMEKAYSYHFVLQDNTGTIIEDLGEQIHDVNKDEVADTAIEFFEFKYNLTNTNNKSYYLYCTLQTINGLILIDHVKIHDSILQGVKIGTNGNLFKINAELIRENGSVKLWAESLDSNISYVGKYVIRRISSKDNYLRIQTLAYFSLFLTQEMLQEMNRVKIMLLEDRTVEAGFSYQYFVQKINNSNIYSQIVGGNEEPIYVSFDDCFLSDGERQLCIQYNPKVSSFKATIQESKIETIGSKYPYIMRNGHINYKEFPISGLISFLVDQNNLFMTKQEKELLKIVPDHTMRGEMPWKIDPDLPATEDNIINTKSAIDLEINRKNNMLDRGTPQNLVDININAEKEFKMLVLDFLNNAKPKLFRSATEGNFCVYTINSSLSPNDTLGRMLHSFNCTAYEIKAPEDFYDDFIVQDALVYTEDGELLDQNGLENYQYYSKTISVDNIQNTLNKNLLQYNEFVKSFQVRDANPLTQFKLVFQNLLNPYKILGEQIISIGATGSYNYFCTEPNVYITKIIPLKLDRENYNSDYFSIILKRYIKVDYDNFNYLIDYQTGNSLGDSIQSSLLDGQEEQIIFYLDPNEIQEENIIKQNQIDYLYLLRVQNRNEHNMETTAFCLDDTYLLNKELSKVRQKLLFEDKVAISKKLAQYLFDFIPKRYFSKMSLNDQAEYFMNNNEGQNVEYYISANSLIQNINIDILWQEIMIPPSTTVILATNIKNVPNIIIKYTQNNKELFYDISCLSSVQTYDYGG